MKRLTSRFQMGEVFTHDEEGVLVTLSDLPQRTLRDEFILKGGWELINAVTRALSEKFQIPVDIRFESPENGKSVTASVVGLTTTSINKTVQCGVGAGYPDFERLMTALRFLGEEVNGYLKGHPMQGTAFWEIAKNSRMLVHTLMHGGCSGLEQAKAFTDVIKADIATGTYRCSDIDLADESVLDLFVARYEQESATA